MNYTPSQLALILDVPQTDIFTWIGDKKLPITKRYKFCVIHEDDLIDFLRKNPDCTGRIYCRDIPGYIDDIRRNISKCLSSRMEGEHGS